MPSPKTGRQKQLAGSPLTYAALLTLFFCTQQCLAHPAQHARASGIEAKRVSIRGEGNPPRGITLHDHEDFCLFGPRTPGEKIGPESAVSWCTKKDRDGAREIPPGIIKGVTYIKANNWVQVSGTGDLTAIHVGPDDLGGQLDSAGRRPEGSRVMVDGKEAASWVSMISGDTFCFRACTGDPKFCPTNFAEQGCYVLLSNAVGWKDLYQTCESEDGLPPGEQGDHAPEWRNCRTTGGISGGEGGGAVEGPPPPPPASSPAPSPTGEEEWVPQETCVPCSDGASQTDPTFITAPTSSSGGSNPESSNSGESTAHVDPRETMEDPLATMQHGVSPVQSHSGANRADALFNELEQSHSASALSTRDASAPAPAPTSPPPPLDDSILARHRNVYRRDEGAPITRDGMCCHTTWVPKSSATPDPQGASPTSASGTGKNQPGPSSASTTSGALITAGTDNPSIAPTATPSLGGTISASSPALNSSGTMNTNTSAVNATGRPGGPNGTGPAGNGNGTGGNGTGGNHTSAAFVGRGGEGSTRTLLVGVIVGTLWLGIGGWSLV